MRSPAASTYPLQFAHVVPHPCLSVHQIAEQPYRYMIRHEDEKNASAISMKIVQTRSKRHRHPPCSLRTYIHHSSGGRQRFNGLDAAATA